MKYSNDSRSFQSLNKRLCAALMLLLFAYFLSSSASAFISPQSFATTPNDKYFNELINSSSRKTGISDFSVALQSRILNLLTHQLIENTNKKMHDSLLGYPVSYKTKTFGVNILADMNNNITIEIHDHGMSPPEIVKISYE